MGLSRRALLLGAGSVPLAASLPAIPGPFLPPALPVLAPAAALEASFMQGFTEMVLAAYRDGDMVYRAYKRPGRPGHTLITKQYHNPETTSHG